MRGPPCGAFLLLSVALAALSCRRATATSAGEGGCPAASSSVPSGASAGSKTPTLSPLRPLSISALSWAAVGLPEAGGGSIGFAERLGGRSSRLGMGSARVVSGKA
jgi:hypothetical protein